MTRKMRWWIAAAALAGLGAAGSGLWLNADERRERRRQAYDQCVEGNLFWPRRPGETSRDPRDLLVEHQLRLDQLITLLENEAPGEEVGAARRDLLATAWEIHVLDMVTGHPPGPQEGLEWERLGRLLRRGGDPLELVSHRDAINAALQLRVKRLEEHCAAWAARAAGPRMPPWAGRILHKATRWWVVAMEGFFAVFVLAAVLAQLRDSPAARAAACWVQALLLAGLMLAAWTWELVEPGGGGRSVSFRGRTGVPLHFDIPCNLALGLLPLHFACLARLLGEERKRHRHLLGTTLWSLGTGLLLVGFVVVWAGLLCPSFREALLVVFGLFAVGVLGFWVFLVVRCRSLLVVVSRFRPRCLSLLLPSLFALATWLWALMAYASHPGLLFYQWSPVVAFLTGMLYLPFRRSGGRAGDWEGPSSQELRSRTR